MNDNLRKRVLKSLIILSVFVIQLSYISALSADSCNLDVSLVNQDPYPATPDNYLKVLIQVTGVDTDLCKGARVSLDLNYPFSMDSGENLHLLKANTYNKEDFKDFWNIPYQLRIDKNALEGESELTVRYAPGNWNSDTYLTKKFNISIKNYQTTFDAVIQDFNSNDISIALANTGKYTANAVIVRIPEQENYVVSSSDGQMVGNLESGDYTMVSFTIVPKQSQQRNNVSNQLSNQKKDLLIQIYYTDNLGEQRIVNMSLPLTMKSSFNNSLSITPLNQNNKNKSSFPWFWLIIFILATLFFLYKKFSKHSKRPIGKLTNKENKNLHIPDWVKNSRESK